MKLFLVSLTALLVIAWGASAAISGGTPQTSYDPTKTKVALLPLVNKADDFAKSFQDKVKRQANKALTERFTSRGFEVIDEATTKPAVDELKIDLSDRENWHAESLIPIGKKLGCRLVLLCVVTDAHSQINNSLFSIGGGSSEGIATVRAYLVDTETGAAILAGSPSKGKSAGGAFGILDKGMTHEAKSVMRGIDHALRDFLSAYPFR
jgi:hypothetical protein